MRITLLRFILIFLTTFGLHTSHVLGRVISEEQIEVSCSNWPYIFIENSEMSGSSYEIAKMVTERAGLGFSYEIYPWARIYHYGLTRSHFMIGCLERAYWRESQFYWIGQINDFANVYFYKRASNPVKINRLYDITNYRVGVQRNSYYERFLLDNSFTDKSIVPLSSHTQALLMLDAGRVDFVLMEEVGVKGLSDKLDFVGNHFEKVLLAYRSEAYLALSKKTPVHIYKRLKEAYQGLYREGKIQEVIHFYFGD